MPTKHGVLLGMDFLSAIRAKIDTVEKQIVLNVESSTTELTEDEEISNEFWPVTQTGETRIIKNENLSFEELETINSLIEKNHEIFANDISDLGCYNLAAYSIKTSSETPIYIPPYRKSLKERNLMQEEVKKMLDAGIIQESKSPWSFPVIIVPKPDGSARFARITDS